MGSSVLLLGLVPAGAMSMSCGVFRVRGVLFLVTGGGGSSRGNVSSPTALQAQRSHIQSHAEAPPARPNIPTTGGTPWGHSPILTSWLSRAQHGPSAGIHLHHPHAGEAGRLLAAQEVVHLGPHGFAQVAEMLAASGARGMWRGTCTGWDVLWPWSGCRAGAGVLKHALVH